MEGTSSFLPEGAVVAPGWVTQQAFLAGYGAAQALPGPLFSFGAFLGASVHPTPSPILCVCLSRSACLLRASCFAMAALLPLLERLALEPFHAIRAQRINASVVGVLIATLFQPLWTSTIHSAGDFWIALLAFALLTVWRLQPWIAGRSYGDWIPDRELSVWTKAYTGGPFTSGIPAGGWKTKSASESGVLG